MSWVWSLGGTQIVEGENHPQVVFWPPRMCGVRHVSTYLHSEQTHKQNWNKNIMGFPVVFPIQYVFVDPSLFLLLLPPPSPPLWLVICHPPALFCFYVACIPKSSFIFPSLIVLVSLSQPDTDCSYSEQGNLSWGDVGVSVWHLLYLLFLSYGYFDGM